MGKRAKRKRAELVEVERDGKRIRVKPAVADVLLNELNFRSAAAAVNLDVVISMPQCNPHCTTAHVQFNAWETGCRVLDWWPGNGTWKRGGGERGTETDWRAVVDIAAKAEVADLFRDHGEAGAGTPPPGASLLPPRRLQQDTLFDTTSQSLRTQGCALRVRVSASSGPSKITVESFSPNASSIPSKTARAAGTLS